MSRPFVQERFRLIEVSSPASTLPSASPMALRPLYEAADELRGIILASTYGTSAERQEWATFTDDKLSAWRVRAEMAAERSRRIGEEYEARLDAAVLLVAGVLPLTKFGAPTVVLKRLRTTGMKKLGLDSEPGVRALAKSLARIDAERRSAGAVLADHPAGVIVGQHPASSST